MEDKTGKRKMNGLDYRGKIPEGRGQKEKTLLMDTTS
jgi:hypothetical protein